MNDPSLTSSQLLLFSERYNLQKRSQGTALLLCFLLGAFGIHKFYLRQNIAGMLYLLFCWSFIPAILSIADLFLISAQVRRYNNLHALEILQAINPHADPELVHIHHKYENHILINLGRILAISAGLLFLAELYSAIMYDLQPNDLTHKLNLSRFWNQQTKSPEFRRPRDQLISRYYNLKYDGLTLNLSLTKAKELGYNQCSTNNFFSVCSNIKPDYPPFLNYPVDYAIAQFDHTNHLILIHLFMKKLPQYRDLVDHLPAETHNTKTTTDYISLAGSHEQISLNPDESSIEIGDLKVLHDYTKLISRQKLLNTTLILNNPLE